ncbi:hypothetical protein Dimus_025616 [Dionaea muscipula]
MESPVRFSSCRGVPFEIKRQRPHVADHAPSSTAAADDERSFRWYSGGLTTSKVIVSAPTLLRRSVNRPSSHFCDLELTDSEEEDHDHEEEFDLFMERMEEGGELVEEEEEAAGDINKKEAAVLPMLQAAAAAASKRTQQQSTSSSKRTQKSSRLWIMLIDQGLFTIYKRLFFICLTLNIIGLVLAATGHFSYARNRPALFSIANILALTLCRSELFLRVVFWLVVVLFGRPWVPLTVKNFTTSILQSVGGIHSGCGISSLAWLVYALVLTLKDRDNTSTAIIAVASAILALICLSTLAAFPLVRHLHHNVFERIHRFAGWAALALLWAFVILTVSYDPTTKSYIIISDGNLLLGSRLIKQQEFWFTVVVTALIIIPWATVRRVPVKVSAPSNHASIVKFEGGVDAGMLGRISPSPLSEWHAFGIISDGKSEHMMLAGAVGDYTKSLIANPPSQLWVRKMHFVGLPYLVHMYERILLVATGSGICVFLSFLLQPTRAEVYFIWVTKGIEQNFGSEIKQMVEKYPQERVIMHDTAILGRPDVSKMSIDAARKWGVQVVFVTSNPEGSRDVVTACKAAGIPAFGPIWDS